MSASVGALDKLVVTPRPLADYRNMFLLTDDDLTAGPILDCPGGASPFGAQVRARGGTVVSVDPAYAKPRADLVAGIRRDLDRLDTWLNTHPDNIDWSYLGSPGALIRTFELAVDFFLSDFTPDGERYVTAALPSLPFADGQFSLTLCSHLLFCYPEYLTFDDHLAGIVELVRVTAGEVRLFPLVDTASVPYPRLEDLRSTLREQGVHTEIREAACAFSVGGGEMLVAWRAG
jgi:hypothetical protein